MREIDVSVKSTLAQTQGLEFKSLERLDSVACNWHPSTGKVERGGVLGLAGQPVQSNWKASGSVARLKYIWGGRGKNTEEDTSVGLWPLHTYAHMWAHTQQWQRQCYVHTRQRILKVGNTSPKVRGKSRADSSSEFSEGVSPKDIVTLNFEPLNLLDNTGLLLVVIVALKNRHGWMDG